MSESQYSGEMTSYEVKPYREPKMKFLALILSFLHLFFICLPIFIIIYLGVDIVFFIRDVYKFLKKTIKHAKAKFEPKPSQGLP